jgi:hypothetical protein
MTVASKICFLSVLGALTGCGPASAITTDASLSMVPRKNFQSEAIPGLISWEASSDLSQRAMTGPDPAKVVTLLTSPKALQKCRNLLYDAVIDRNFPMTRPEYSEYSKAIMKALKTVKTVNVDIHPEGKPCGIFAALTIAPSPLPFTGIFELVFVVYDRELLRASTATQQNQRLADAAVWSIVVRRAIALSPTPQSEYARVALPAYQPMFVIAADSLLALP